MLFLSSVKIVLKNCVWIFVMSCLIFYSCNAQSGSDFEPGGKPYVKVLNPAAEAVIGAVVNVRNRGPGIFGCGERRLDGVTSADALRWAVDELNKKIWSGSSPNVSIGLHLMDSCSRTRTAASQLAEFLPELKGEGDERPNLQNLPFKLGVIDDIGFEQEVDVSKALEDLSIPVIKTDVQTESVQLIVTTLLSFLRELRWEHLVLAHSNSRASLSILKAFTKAIKKSDLCVPWIVNVENVLSGTENNEWSDILRSGVPILSLLPSKEHALLLKNFKNVPVLNKKIRILFTDFVSREDLKSAPANKIELFAMISYPEKDNKFENFLEKNSIITGVRTEDELALVQRTKTAQKIKGLVEKMSVGLGEVIREVCPNEGNLCPDIFTSQGKNSYSEYLSSIDWTDNGKPYGLFKYQYQFPDGHVSLNKVMVYNAHNNLEVFPHDLPENKVDCDNDYDFKPECQCLEFKNGRSGSARNIDEQERKRQRFSVNKLELNEEHSSTLLPQVKHPDQLTQNNPSVYSSLRDPLNASLSVLTILGALLTLFTGQYFATFAALPNGGLTSGTSVLGYYILLALFLLYSTNLSFIFTPSVSSCAIRRFGPSLGYAMAFSGMLIKVWVSWRQASGAKSDSWKKPSTLVSLAVLFSAVQILLSGTWIVLVPPVIHYDRDKWVCYPSADLDSHLLVSMMYIVGLLFGTAVFAIKTCSQMNNSEARWILISSSLVAIIFCCWGISVATNVWQMQRTASTNLAAATIVLLCLYIPKIKLHFKLKKSKADIRQYPIEDFDKEYRFFASASPPFPVMLDYNVVTPVISEDLGDSGYSNQACSIDEGTESVSMSIPFEIETSSYSEPEQPEPLTFSTFFDDPPSAAAHNLPTKVINDPTQVVPSALYPLDMFNNEPDMDSSEHCQPGTNEFTPAHRTSSQMYLNPPPEWVP